MLNSGPVLDLSGLLREPNIWVSRDFVISNAAIILVKWQLVARVAAVSRSVVVSIYAAGDDMCAWQS